MPTKRFVLEGAELVLVDAGSVASDQLMATAAGLVMNVSPRDVVVGRNCPNCGGVDHGQPFAHQRGATTRACYVSLSRASGYSVAAARAGSPIGVDLESISAAARHPLDGVLLTPQERRALAALGSFDARFVARLWVAKEAITKMAGVGLRAELTELHVRLNGQTAEFVEWPSGPRFDTKPRVALFDVTDDVVGALAVLD